MPDLSTVPLAALSSESKHLISTLLNPPKVIPSSTGRLRDWRGIAEVCSIGGEELPAIAADPDPCSRMLTIVQKRSQDFTLLSLKNALEEIGRWDIVDDSETYLEKDAESYLQRLSRSQTSAQENDFNADTDVLTLDDQVRIERGESEQHYDAFLLYADEDIAFVNDIIENLENKHNLKLCLKDRDLIPGISFEHEAIMRLISERCNRLIPVMSPNFLNSPANKFFLNYAQANGIDKRQERKIIPCVYETCEFPPQLTYFSKIYYNKVSPNFFWDKLARSMRVVSAQNTDTKKGSKSATVQKSEAKRASEPQLSTIHQNGYPKSEQNGLENKTEESIPRRMSNPVKMLRNRFSFSWRKRKEENSDEKLDNAQSQVSLQESTLNLPSPPSSQVEDSQDSTVTLPSPPSSELDSVSSIAPIMGTSSNETKTTRKKKFLKNVKKLLAQ